MQRHAIQRNAMQRHAMQCNAMRRCASVCSGDPFSIAAVSRRGGGVNSVALATSASSCICVAQVGVFLHLRRTSWRLLASASHKLASSCICVAQVGVFLRLRRASWRRRHVTWRRRGGFSRAWCRTVPITRGTHRKALAVHAYKNGTIHMGLAARATSSCARRRRQKTMTHVRVRQVGDMTR